jgi:hypothetical protein
MAFKNEYVPPLEQETSEFFKRARETLHIGYNKNDAWTVDRESKRVLSRTGCGHEIDDRDEEYWEYLDGDDCYGFTTKELNYSLIEEGPPKKIAITRDILYFKGGAAYKGIPEAKIIQRIKDAFQVHGGACMASQNKVFEHTLLWSGVVV